MRRGLWSATVLLIVATCAAPRPATLAPTETGGASGHAAGPAIDDSAGPLTIEIVTSAYGKLIIRTRPDATCRARATLPSGNLVLAGDFVIEQHPDADGQAIWIYRTPVTGAGSGTGQYAGCTSGLGSVDAAVDFDVP